MVVYDAKKEFGVLAKRKWVLMAGIISVMVVIGSIVTFYSGWFSPPSPSTVRVGWLTGDLHDLTYFVAKDETVGGGTSFFEKYGVTVTNAKDGGYANGGYVMDAIAAGEVDIGYLGSAPAITKHLNLGVNTTIIAQVNEIGSALVTKQPITSLNDLIGKTIATPGVPTIQYFLFLRLAESEGIDIGNFNLTTVPITNMIIQLDAGSIDAFIAWEPYCSYAVVNNAGVIYKNSSDIWPNHICCVVVASKTFAANHPDIVVNFLKAHIAATNWINEAKASGVGSEKYNLLVNIATSFTGMTDTVIERALTNVIYKYDIDATFMGVFIEFTNKLIQYTIVQVPLQERGYTDVQDFYNKYVNISYLTEAKQT